jgi:dihydrofolate reductase
VKLGLSLIFAVAENGALGKDGGLPWDFSEDREHFLQTTRGHVMIMGRRTWEEAGAPLPDRTSIVVSRSFVPPPGVLHAKSLKEAVDRGRAIDPEPFVIGGARLFAEALPLATRVYVTRIPGRPVADTYFHFDPTGFRRVRSWNGEHGLLFEILEREHLGES